MANRLECIDAGSDYCPCYLAELNECITCSQLQGKKFCDCNWKGVCIYQEYVWAGNKAKSTRNTIFSNVIDKQKINDSLLILTLSVPNKMARDLNEPGSYVFLRGVSSPSFFDTPMSIMYSDEMKGIIKVAIQINGPKTRLIDECKGEVYLRGPYWNGLMGHRYIKGIRNSKCLVVLRGIAQAPGVIVINKLHKNNNDITVIIDKGKIGENFINSNLSDLKLNILETDLLSIEGQKLLKNTIADNDIKLIYSGGSDEQHLNILDYIDMFNNDAYLAVSNNNTICCGEGICGSCEVQIDGQKIRSCKVQLDVRKAIERRILHA
ncbi:sulfide/dihydroorotate dehydrogenase-like FAD/NAD-binding protein [Thermoanaerobacterium sp. RBIITD]|uniref:sulfide/dihydroorotate dehydrogenase-like FAD/NAD-binding protein n=1 Tax=Thermoanaerobacterium sp. RBIITD TaxID=1550240 RepID=UPI000BB8E53A|nr:sulfide/dihydroorotate dehydrogenase-like FAD/NAD-binding protein [Thermoanaerobacterium sp. RBIITD]SNX55404.1 NAD(P)H-flavin reductase [Thermoanaerobacterium sp. RBIITD]